MEMDRGPEESFNKVKDLVTSDLVLTLYSQDLPISLACDASPFGHGAVISHDLPDNTEKPIALASCALTTAKKNYSQIDKGALVIMFIIDRQPLIHIFSPRQEFQ